jgi:hypothetical protein
VDEHGAEPGSRASLPERCQVGRIVVGEAPGTRALDEELDGVGVDVDGAVDRFLDPASTVGSEQHGVNLAS